MRQPFAAFDKDHNNTDLYVVEPSSGKTWGQNLKGLPKLLREQLQSTNAQFLQIDTVLYLIGGYAFAGSSHDHITHDLLTAINLPGAIRAIQNDDALSPHFRFTRDKRLCITGGQLGQLKDRFYLVGGQNFIGNYNPAGPENGPGFFQEYSNAIRSFRLLDNGRNLAILDYRELKDSLALHRRDYNMVPQIFPDGELGYTIFSGVFRYDDNLPWLDALDLRDRDSFQVVPGFEQLLNHYQTANLPVYDSRTGRMHTLFFGGIARYYFDASGGFVDDINVPFVQTISRVTRFPDGSVREYDTEQRMPGYLGAAAEFIPVEGAPFLAHDILDLAKLEGRTHVGYIYGGIESSMDNIFFSNTGVESWASKRLFKVFVEPGVVAKP